MMGIDDTLLMAGHSHPRSVTKGVLMTIIVMFAAIEPRGWKIGPSERGVTRKNRKLYSLCVSMDSGTVDF